MECRRRRRRRRRQRLFISIMKRRSIVFGYLNLARWQTWDEARIGVKIGAFADPTFPAPKISGFEEYQHPWAMNVGALPMPDGHHE